MNAENPLAAWQQEMLRTFGEQQEAYLEALAAWRKTFDASTVAGAAPTPPMQPTVTPDLGASKLNVAEAMESSREFMEAVSKQQQDFFDKLTRVLGPDGS